MFLTFFKDCQLAVACLNLHTVCKCTAENSFLGVRRNICETAAACDSCSETADIHITVVIDFCKTKEAKIQTAAIVEVELEALMKDCIRVSCNTEVTA